MPQTNIDFQNLPSGTILQDNGKIYKVTRPSEKDGQKLLKEIGNFSIDILAYSSQHKKYLINLNGRLKIDTLDFTATIPRFREYIRPFHFLGTGEDLEALTGLMCEKIKEEEKEDLIIVEDFVGKYEDAHITFWVFEDKILITHKDKNLLKEAQLVDISKQAVLKIDDFWLYFNHENINRSLVPIYEETQDYSLEAFLSDWLKQVKNQRLLYSLLGWIIASIHLEQVNKLRKCKFFPFYLLTAATETGKTALLANCMKICGVNYIGENFASSVTRFVEVVEFAQVSHLPIWRDEYKNEKYALEKEGWLRSLYTRSGSSRGTRDQTVTQYPSNATLLLSGEDITEDPALARRMIKMRLHAEDRVSLTEHQENTEVALLKFPSILPKLITAQFSETIFKEIFFQENLKEDTAYKDEMMCYAVLGAVFGKEVGLQAIEVAKQDQAFSARDAMSSKSATVEDFFASVDAIFLEKGWYDSIYNQKPRALDYFYFPKTQENTVYFRFAALHNLVSKLRPRDEYKWSKKAIAQLIFETYKAKAEPRRIDEVSTHVYIVEGTNEIIDVFGDLIQKLRMVQEKWLLSQLRDPDEVQSPFKDIQKPLIAIS